MSTSGRSYRPASPTRCRVGLLVSSWLAGAAVGCGADAATPDDACTISRLTGHYETTFTPADPECGEAFTHSAYWRDGEVYPAQACPAWIDVDMNACTTRRRFSCDDGHGKGVSEWVEELSFADPDGALLTGRGESRSYLEDGTLCVCEYLVERARID